jgi:heme/copper-type cytochrome/quinol oxidase subunit 2
MRTLVKIVKIILGCVSAIWGICILILLLLSLLAGLSDLLMAPQKSSPNLAFGSGEIFYIAVNLVVTGSVSYACFISAFRPNRRTLQSRGRYSRIFENAVLGAVLGAVTAAVIIWILTPSVTPNSDGMNRYGGQMFLMMLGIFIGGVCGAIKSE